MSHYYFKIDISEYPTLAILVHEHKLVAIAFASEEPDFGLLYGKRSTVHLGVEPPVEEHGLKRFEAAIRCRVQAVEHAVELSSVTRVETWEWIAKASGQ